MRVNLITEHTSGSGVREGTIPLSLTIRPACGVAGEYVLATDSKALMRLLRQRSDLSGVILDRFENKLGATQPARLLGVDLSESVLTDIGYFTD